MGSIEILEPAVSGSCSHTSETKEDPSATPPCLESAQPQLPVPSMTSKTMNDPSTLNGDNSAAGANPQQQLEEESVPTTPRNNGKKRKATTTCTPSPRSEKRLRRFRSSPPTDFYKPYDRALSQRFYVIKRQRGGTDDCPEETIYLAGSTGNVYTIHITREPTCNCPHALSGHQCKHLIYILSRVLRAKYEFVYQLALLSNELREIFAGAPPISTATVNLESGDKPNTRKPVEGDCVICFCKLDPRNGESIVWCAAGCGQNIHRECFDTWAATKQSSGPVACPFCRTPWKKGGDTAKRTTGPVGVVNGEGYLNVGRELGMSTVRDTSTYSSWYHLPPSRRRRWADLENEDLDEYNDEYDEDIDDEEY